MPAITKSLITNLLALSLAATGGYVGGFWGLMAGVGAAVIGSTVVMYTAVDAYGEGHTDGKEETDL